MPERVPGKPLDRLHRLVMGKPTADEFEDLGGNFDAHLHFVALLPSPALPAREAEKVQKYFDTMLEALEPARDAIAAYWLEGVMSRAPISDFSFEVHFRDAATADRIRKLLPKDMSSRVAPNRRARTDRLGPLAGASPP